MNIPVEEILQDARAEYQALLARFQTLDARIAADVPAWDAEDRFCALLAPICVDIAILMLGADRNYTDVECRAFNTIFDLHEEHALIRMLAERQQQQRPGAAALYSRLDRFLMGLSVVRQPPDDPIEPAADFFRTL